MHEISHTLIGPVAQPLKLEHGQNILPDSFAKVLDGMRAGERSGSTSGLDTISESLRQFQRDWASSIQKIQSRIKTLSPESRSLVQLQLEVHRLHLGSEFIMKASEGVSQTLKRTQQMG